MQNLIKQVLEFSKKTKIKETSWKQTGNVYETNENDGNR